MHLKILLSCSQVFMVEVNYPCLKTHVIRNLHKNSDRKISDEAILPYYHGQEFARRQAKVQNVLG